VGHDDVERAIDRYPVDYLLVDTYVAGESGGTGRRFDWQPAREWARRCRLFLAGGLDAAVVGEAIARVRPFAVDVSSGVEASPGRKDPRRVEALVAAVRRADLATATHRAEND
jgi:phosphoribosylanthranilate isomerase